WGHPSWSISPRITRCHPPSWFYPQTRQRLACGGLLQQCLKRDHTWPIRAGTWHDEVVLLRLHGQESESGAASNGIQSHSPIRPTLYNGGGDRVVIARLHCISVRPC